ncbi:DUF1120 domain-containing protein, partial [Serratia fonticola]
MLNTIQKTVCALAVLSATALPALAESVDVRVVGTITPTACTPVLAGGGTIDYGNIQPSSLAKDTYTVLDEKQLDFSITCDAPAKVAIKATSQRGNSAVSQADGSLSIVSTGNTLFGATGVGAYGLGLDAGKGIGGYGLRLAAGTMMADDVAVDSIQANGNTTTWAKTAAGSLIGLPTSIRYATWAATGTTTPIAFTTLTGKLGVQAYINKASELDLTKPV